MSPFAYYYSVTAENISEEGAKETYGKVLGVVFNPVPFQMDLLSPNPEQGNGEGDGVHRANDSLFSLLKKRLFPPSDVSNPSLSLKSDLVGNLFIFLC